jgi:transcriptional regulator with XRE-family HTH domain
MPKLTEIIARARESVEYRLAQRQAHNDYALIEDLVTARVEAGLRQQDVADALGVTQQAVSKFEHAEGDPRLSTIRQYAAVVGCSIAHVVTPGVGEGHAERPFDESFLQAWQNRAVMSAGSTPVAVWHGGDAMYVPSSRRTEFAMAA